MMEVTTEESNMALIESIHVQTAAGKRQIQLMVGDITDLPMSNKVDVIMVSSFPGDYSAIKGTLIGALRRRWQINVRELAMHKAEDMRRNFNCWISKALPKDVPFGRLLCFEQNPMHSVHPSVAVAEIFRALFTVVAEKEQSVITPLLATGNQNASKRRMLSGLVTSCASWMRAGLLLRELKLVIYSRRGGQGPSIVSRLAPDDKAAVSEFKLLKKRLEKQYAEQSRAIEITHDLYISYAANDEDRTQQMMSLLREKKSDSLKIIMKKHSEKKTKEYHPDDEEDDDVTVVLDPQEKRKADMCRCRHVVTLLSPHYLCLPSCVEDYNLALCLGRVVNRSLLAPLYIEIAEDLPTYMTMTQWIDCRAKRAGDDPDRKLADGCEKLLSMLENSSAKYSSVRNADDNASKTYEVFLSYAHRDAKVAGIFIEELKKSQDINNIFFDRDEIKTGFSWLQTVYNALDNSRTVVAMVSPSYCASSMCREEFALAQMLHQTSHYTGTLLPVLVEPLNSTTSEDVPPIFIKETEDQWMDATSNPSKVAVEITGRIAKLLKSNQPTSRDIDVVRISEDFRRHFFKKFWNIVDSGYPSLKKPYFDDDGKMKDTAVGYDYDVVLSYHANDHLYGRLLRKVLFARRPSLRIGEATSSLEPAVVMATLEHARIMVPLLSLSYTTNPDCMSQLYVALCRRRSSRALLCPVAIATLSHRPSFISLLPVKCHVQDQHWTEIAAEWNYLTAKDAFSDDPIPNVPLHYLRHNDGLPNRLLKPSQISVVRRCPVPPDVFKICNKDKAFGFSNKYSTLPIRTIIALSCACDIVLLQLDK